MLQKGLILFFIFFQNVWSNREQNRFDDVDDVEYPADVLEEMKKGGMDISGFGLATSGMDNQV